MKHKFQKLGFAIKSFFLLFTVFLIVFFVIFVTIENDKIHNVLDEIKLKEEVFVKSQSNFLISSFKKAISDLIYLSDNFDLTRQNIQNDWSVVLESNRAYNKIRYIDLHGNEVSRIDYFEGKAVIADSEDFLNIKEETYFSETIILDKGQVYVSKMNKIINKNNTEELSIMFCTPIHSENMTGILVLDCNAQFILDELKSILNLETIRDEVYLINDFGYWVSSEGDYREADVKYYDIAYDIGILPDEKWNEIKESKHNITENGIYTFEEINYIDSLNIDKELAENKIVFRETSCKVATLIEDSSGYDYYIYSDFSMKFNKIISERYPFLIVFFLASVLIVFLLLRNQTKMKQMRDSSKFDSLTKVYNRRQGFIELEERVSYISYYKKVCLCFIDINGLKDVNDTLGHVYGDELILAVVDTIRNTIRERDLIIRMGGDEFLIAFMKVGKAIAETIWLRIVESFKGINSMEDRNYIISASHGIVEIKDTENKIDLSALITKADDKMYTEKVRIKKSLSVIRRKF